MDEESSDEKRVKIEKNPPTPSKREVVEEVEKGAPIVMPHPYTHRFLSRKVLWKLT